MRRLIIAIVTVFAVVFTGSGLAYACGGLIAPNGSVQLLRTSTLVAYADGVEHYITSFEFGGAPESFGSIVPLPGEPTDVQRAGDWTLQRLEREVRPVVEAPEVAVAFEADATAGGVEVILETRIDSLDITIVKGGGSEVAAWAGENGFLIDDQATTVLDRYGERSPYFMAARFDADAAFADGFRGGDGIPVHLTIPVEAPWVPLHILSIGKPGSEIVEADVFLLTEEEPVLFAGPGTLLQRSEPANDLLLDDLRSDERMEWVPREAWFSWLSIEARADQLTYDLETDARPEETPTAVASQTANPQASQVLLPVGTAAVEGDNLWPIVVLVLGLGALVVVAGGLIVIARRPVGSA